MTPTGLTVVMEVAQPGVPAPAHVTLVLTVEELRSDPPGYLVRGMLRSSGRQTRVIGPDFVQTAEQLRQRVAEACDQVPPAALGQPGPEWP